MVAGCGSIWPSHLDSSYIIVNVLFQTNASHAHEALLQKARARQQMEGFKALYNPRSAVERIIGELVRHGLRQTRYIGERKRRLQRLWTAAAVNLKRLFTLAQANNADLHAAIAALA